MSNMDTALVQATLMMPTPTYPAVPNPNKPRTRFQMAKRVFQLAASGGFPYTGMTSKQWAKKWLSSDSFRLMEIDINAAASPHMPKNPERVAFRVLCNTDSMDPIVVDLNRQKVGKSHLGYIPEVIVVDGKHRKQGQLLQGHTRILAWVGCKAEKKIQSARVIDKLEFAQVHNVPSGRGVIREAVPLTYTRGQKEFLNTPMASTVNLHCAVTPATGAVVVNQSGGEGGSRPRQAVVRGKKMKSAGGAGGMGGSLGGGSGSNPMTMRAKKVIDECNACGPAFSEGHFDPSASDEASATGSASYKEKSPNIKAPGAKGWSGLISSPTKQSPGSGVGPRTSRSTGATRSEMSRLADTVPTIQSSRVRAKAKVIDKIYVKDREKRKLFPR